MENKTIKFSSIEEHAEWLGKFAHLECKVNSSSETIDFYGLTQEQVELLNAGIRDSRWWINTETGLVDVGIGGIVWSNLGLTDFKGIKLGTVEGNFYCNNNQLSSLEGAPQVLGMGFYCQNNQLNTLKGAPQKVGWFSGENNQLTTLEGAPQEVVGNFYCNNNQLVSLEGAPQKVGKDFYCNNNQLTTLEGAPKEVGDGFHCENNQLTTLEGAPQEVGGCFYCYRNQLTTLEGAPRKVGGYGFSGGRNPVSNETLETIFSSMEGGKSYLEAVESLWPKIPPEDQALLYRPEFEWVTPEKKRSIELLIEYNRIREML